jgi:hypothetical protein
MSDEKANIFKVRYLYGRHGRICGGHKRESECALPGEISPVCLVPRPSRGGGMDGEKSAEGIVCAGQRSSQEGSSPSGSRMRGAISKSGGNASLAGESE